MYKDRILSVIFGILVVILLITIVITHSKKTAPVVNEPDPHDPALLMAQEQAVLVTLSQSVPTSTPPKELTAQEKQVIQVTHVNDISKEERDTQTKAVLESLNK